LAQIASSNSCRILPALYVSDINIDIVFVK
jgi:hypothetical protein